MKMRLYRFEIRVSFKCNKWWSNKQRGHTVDRCKEGRVETEAEAGMMQL